MKNRVNLDDALVGPREEHAPIADPEAMPPALLPSLQTGIYRTTEILRGQDRPGRRSGQSRRMRRGTNQCRTQSSMTGLVSACVAPLVRSRSKRTRAVTAA